MLFTCSKSVGELKEEQHPSGRKRLGIYEQMRNKLLQTRKTNE